MAFLSYTQDLNNNLLMLLLRDHKRYMPIVEFFDNMTQKLSELTWGEAELIAFEISKENQSIFCSGIRKGMLDALDQDVSIINNEKFLVALDFAHKVNKAPKLITQKEVNQVLEAGWSEQTVEDIVGLVAIQNVYNTIATSLGFKEMPQAAFSEIGLGTVQRGGYESSFTQFIET